MKIGFGYDVHPLKVGEKLVLGGVTIPFSKGLQGHSDADALVHAVIDALLGAAGLGDIGSHFPDSANEYENISSLILLKESLKIIKDKGFEIGNIDTTIVLEEPKLSRYKAQMISNISDKLDIEKSQISIKATKEEGMGFVGEGKGIKVFAVAAIQIKK